MQAKNYWENRMFVRILSTMLPPYRYRNSFAKSNPALLKKITIMLSVACLIVVLASVSFQPRMLCGYKFSNYNSMTVPTTRLQTEYNISV